ncbi:MULTISPECIES: Nif3-like dinuclear metal center hexameric protein [unclassified Pseudonocardia]|uniref:Nif3-like dinuclear metal center hexameric protein n=1 Tax=unclassified Pseudonocardia TaxID=2619320 RepID=UPI00096103AF|nr:MULTISPECIES: Nif3-like dinuclear metal center hexameric protein [unclassified Pseudonocardia]MBN9101751.1 Nif3-like dinuclear metal center hexameric protein [Pseudonocardia sp.]OJY49981.1 MAG: Nif3-like dinuclear metal center hexameric protein [Pseudonocardia sp. 73-21]
MSARVGDVIAVLEAAYPPALAADWDAVGLVCGDPDEPVSSVLVAVDPVPETVAEAAGDQLLVTHHPLLLRGVHGVGADTPKGALVHRLIRSGTALFTAHTNADSADPGVSDALAAALGLTVEGPLQGAPMPALDKIVTFIPVGPSITAVHDALSAAGAGAIGDYSHCSFATAGTGQFKPLTGANPVIGEVGRLERVAETRLEMVLPRGKRAAVVAALRASHPYEEPAFDVLELAELPSSQGLGRIGTLAAPEPLSAFTARVAAALPETVWGVRAAGEPDRMISRVAVCGGAGDSALGAATAAGVDVYVTADLRHHPASEHVLLPGSPALVDVAHWASEWPWCEQAAGVVRSALGGSVEVRVSRLRTDPWSIGRTI